jgi:hypothetical protein
MINLKNMKPFIRCASMTMLVAFFTINANAQNNSAKDSVEIATHPCAVIVTSLQEVKATATQDASTVSMESDIRSSAEPLKTGSTSNLLPSYIRQIKIYDVAGVIRKTLNYNESANTQVNVNVSDLSIGSYFLEATVNQKTLNKQKIVIER